MQLANSGRYLPYLLDEDNNLLVHPHRQPDLGFNRVPVKVDERVGLFLKANQAVEAIRGSDEAEVPRDTFEIVLRGQDRRQLEQAGVDLLRQFRPHLSKSPILAKNEYAVYCCRLRFSSPHSSQPPRYFKLAMATSREGLAWDIDRQLSVLWRSFFWAIPLCAGATLGLSWWIVRPLKKDHQSNPALCPGRLLGLAATPGPR